MRALFLIAVLVFFSLLVVINGQDTSSPKSPAIANAASKDPLTNELVRISSQIFDAGIKGDPKVIEELFAEDFLEIDALGVLRDKDWNLKNFLPANEKITYQIVDPQVRRRDDIALLYYTLNIRYDITTKLTGNANTVTDTSYPKLRVVDTFVKTKAGWKLLASSRVVVKTS